MSRKSPKSFSRIFTCLLAVIFLSGSGCFAQEQQYPQVLKQQVQQQIALRLQQLRQAIPGGLKDKFPFPIGAAVKPQLFKTRPQYQILLNREFNSLTDENGMKPLAMHPAEGVYAFDAADSLVAYAQATGKRIHGHTLIWGAGLPKWMQIYQGSSSDWDKLMKDHIQTIVRHFKGKVEGWDVVNEAINDDGSFRQNIWYKNVGPDYIEKAYRYAHEADPNAKLLYNDYGHEYSPKKRKAIINMVLAARSKGIPIDGFGLQFHTYIGRNLKDYSSAIDDMAKTGLLVHISELDIAANSTKHPTTVYDDATQQLQGAVFGVIFRSYLKVPAVQRYGITFWGVTDGDSWLIVGKKKTDWPLLFDKTYQRKAVYDSVMKAATPKSIF